MQSIQQLQFDRRPSTILRAFAPKAEKEPDPKKNKSDKPKPDPFAEELRLFQKNVTIGKWIESNKFLTQREDDEGNELCQKQLEV